MFGDNYRKLCKMCGYQSFHEYSEDSKISFIMNVMHEKYDFSKFSGGVHTMISCHFEVS